MLTGARLGEVRTATFDQFKPRSRDLDQASGLYQAAPRPPGAISHEVVALIRLRKQAVPEGCPFLFPGDVPDSPWAIPSGSGCASGRWPRSPTCASTTCGTPSPRPRLRRGIAGNDRAAAGAYADRTTQRYAHLIDAPLRAGSTRWGDAEAKAEGGGRGRTHCCPVKRRLKAKEEAAGLAADKGNEPWVARQRDQHGLGLHFAPCSRSQHEFERRYEPAMGMNRLEHDLETDLLEKLQELKYEYRSDIRDRAYTGSKTSGRSSSS